MEVEIISKECIKPSSPTPHHLRNYKLSLLDQFIPPAYIPMVLFYPIDGHNPIKKDGFAFEKITKLLKRSLSHTLSRFYPLAGKIKDNLSIDCNDEGVYYVEARVKSNLFEFLKQPDLSQIKNFIHGHMKLDDQPTVGAHVAMVQLNVFDCGGIVLSVRITHMIADGVAMSTFLKDWGATTRGCCDGQVSIRPDFITAPSLFPQNDSFPKESSMLAMLHPFFKTGKAITRRFVFDSLALATLKAKATSTWVENPTRVEVVTGLIWKCVMTAFRINSGTQRPSLLYHTINLRRRAGPQFSEFTMGNLLSLAIAQCTDETESKLSDLVHELRGAITKIQSGFLETVEGDQGFCNFCEALKEMGEVVTSAAFSSKGADMIGFSSWINFGLYEVDFGWGKPVWATYVGKRDEQASVTMNFVFLKETRWGNGIEAWVTLDEQDMAILECDEELLSFASVDPSPLKIGR